uniref:Uncharacterized protein MANES_12G071900 n=1 Tax=Rhizophora mucronata TaxID=61149 RepID=A0A2P2IL75_RHIMU
MLQGAVGPINRHQDCKSQKCKWEKNFKPQRVNPQVNCRVQSSMVNQFRFWHFQCRRHPIQKLHI